MLPSDKKHGRILLICLPRKYRVKFRVVHYYPIGDSSNYDPEYYESIKDDYPKMYILELVYNGEIFRVSHYEGEELYESEFKYLVKYEGKAETPDATYTSFVRYVLVNDDKVTWDDIMHGVSVPGLGDYISYRVIYTDLFIRRNINESIKKFVYFLVGVLVASFYPYLWV